MARSRDIEVRTSERTSDDTQYHGFLFDTHRSKVINKTAARLFFDNNPNFVRVSLNSALLILDNERRRFDEMLLRILYIFFL